METDLGSLGFVASQAALLAGDLLKRGFGTVLTIQHKSTPQDYVTQFDHQAEELIIQSIKEHYPESGFICEESGTSPGDKLVWIIDPLDGTTNFVHQLPLFATSIAAVFNGTVLASAIYIPMTGELFSAIRGMGAYLNGKRIFVSDVTDHMEGLYVCGFPYKFGPHPEKRTRPLTNMLHEGLRLRDFGSATIDLAYVAAGRFDGWWLESLGPWDGAGGYLLVKEAGGEVTHMDGSTYDIFAPKSCLATNKELHKKLLTLIQP